MSRYLILDGMRVKTVPEAKYLYDSFQTIFQDTSDEAKYVVMHFFRKNILYNILVRQPKKILCFLKKTDRMKKKFFQPKYNPQIKKIILGYKPTHIIVKGYGYDFFSEKLLSKLKEKLKFKIVLIEVEINNFLNNINRFYYYQRYELNRYDKVLMISKQMTNYLNALGNKKAVFLPAFTKKLEKPIKSTQKDTDLFLYGAFSMRRAIILEKLKKYNLKVVGESWAENKVKWINSLTSKQLRKKMITKEFVGAELADLICRSKIILNISRENWFCIESGVTVRHHQVLAHGGFLLTEYCQELGDVYTMGEDLETYKTMEEMEDKIEFYLKHDSAREKIAQRGHETFLKRHTADIRAKEILTILDSI